MILKLLNYNHIQNLMKYKTDLKKRKIKKQL